MKTLIGMAAAACAAGIVCAQTRIDAGVLGEVSVSPSTFVNWENAHVHPLDITPDGTLLLGVNTADNRLEIFTLRQGVPRWVRSVPVGLDPVSVRVRSNTEAWVVNHISDSVSIVDLTTLNVTSTIDTDDEPCDVVFASGSAFVSCSQANLVQVFDETSPGLPTATILINGEDPRSLAVSPDGTEVYAAIFQSGNASTVLNGGHGLNGAEFPRVVNNPTGPHSGQNPPPNSGAIFEPPLNLNNAPNTIASSLIIKKDASGSWMDDNNGDWTDMVSGPNAGLSGRPVGWDMPDRDVAIIDAVGLSVTGYAHALMNANMAMSVNPASGLVTVVGTDGINEIRFEPNLNGIFTRVLTARFDPADPGNTTNIKDLNDHLTYATETVGVAQRNRSIGDPRAVAWKPAGGRGYVAGQGSNNIIVINPNGARALSLFQPADPHQQGRGPGDPDVEPVIAPPIEIGAGPTGLVVSADGGMLYSLNRFDGSVSAVNLSTENEIARVPFYDPTPNAIKDGRPHLYDTHETSGLGHAACASCHIDSRFDRLAWDLGDPSADIEIGGILDQNLGLGLQDPNDFDDWHPMKGPMVTQTLQDIIGKEPHHWRGDRFGIEEFNGAFEGLLGDDEQLTTGEMQQFEDFLATIHFPPNPFRNLDNTLPTALPLTQFHGQTGQTLTELGNANAGLVLYGAKCITCHTLPTGLGADKFWVPDDPQNPQGPGMWTDFPVGVNGEHHSGLIIGDGQSNVTMKIPQIRDAYEKTGFDFHDLENNAGFGFLHDGTVTSLAEFIDLGAFNLQNNQEVADLTAFVMSMSGDTSFDVPADNILFPPGQDSLSTHAAVGVQITATGPLPAVLGDTLNQLVALADAGEIGLVVKGVFNNERRGFSYLGGNQYQSDRAAETVDHATLLASASPAAELTWTGVPTESTGRIGTDRDDDGFLDADESDVCADPADPLSTPLNAVCCIGDVTTQGAAQGDIDYGLPDGATTTADLQFYVNAFVAGDASIADLTTQGAAQGDPGFGVPDGLVTAADLQFFVNAWLAGCP